ncbi:MAG: hypothetical protein DMD89_35140 [Candidatus Rokuibacteriota bacterium]|nr:MAG: hypothetical protein DMD89_35140 [Candidatus Rokubacteria bacterium]
MVDRRRLIVAFTLAATTAITGCAGKEMTGAKMCEAHGGKYNSSGQSCAYTTPMMTAQQICTNHTGYWDPAAQICKF